MSILDSLTIPIGWEAERFDRYFTKVKRVGYPKEQPLSVFLGAGVVPRDSREDNHNRLGADLDKYQLVQPGDLVFNRLRTWQGGFGASVHRGIVSPAYIVGSPHSTIDSRFVHFLMLSSPYLAELTRVSKFMPPSQFDILWEDLRTVSLLAPPLPIQKAIADFLDRKTAAIDALIEKKQKLLELLAEKRAALINQAVTKGLDPTVPMKDSGIPWIGEVPAHWEVKRLKNLSNFITSGPRGWGQYYSDAGPLFLRITNVARDGVDLLLDDEKRQSVSPPAGAEGMRTLATAGDLLVTITADLGSVGIVPEGLGEAYISQHVALCRPDGGMIPRLMAYMVRSKWGRVHFELSMSGGTKVGLNLDDVRNTPIAVPPPEEQLQILSRVDKSSKKIDSADHSLSNQIDRLTEYRQALITAAVTGQLEIPEQDAS